MKRLSALLISASAIVLLPLGSQEEAPVPVNQLNQAIRQVRDGKFAQAEGAIRDAISSLVKDENTGPEHPAVARYRVILGVIMSKQDKFAEAADCAAAAIPALEKDPDKSLGPENPYAMSARWLGAIWARESGQPAKAAEWLAPLHSTLGEYVASGRAKQAEWDTIPQFKQILVNELPPLDESGVAMVGAMLGQNLADAERYDDALPVLDQAKAALEELSGPDHPGLAGIHKALDQIARAREEQGIRHYVGDLGRVGAIGFVGNDRFSTEDLRRALARDLSFVLASHRSERFDKFLPVIAEQLSRGYRDQGFPEVKVEAVCQKTEGTEKIQVTISEGPRYRQGDIRIEAEGALDNEQFLAAMKDDSEESRETRLAGRIRATIPPLEMEIPGWTVPDRTTTDGETNTHPPTFSLRSKAGSPGAGKQSSTGRSMNYLLSSPAGLAAWQPGEPVSFKPDDPAPLLYNVRRLLAAQGWPMAKATTSYELRPDGTADLHLVIEDLGLETVVGKVNVIGASRNTVEEIRSTAGIEPGMKIRSGLVDGAILALWRSARFSKFIIDSQSWGAGTREVDFLIIVGESKHAPPLSEPLTPEQEITLRCLDWVNRGTDGEDLVVEWNDSSEVRFIFGWSERDGLILELLKQPDGPGITTSVSPTGVCLAVRDRENLFPARVNLPIGDMAPYLHLKPASSELSGTVNFGMRWKSSRSKDQGVPKLDLLVSPALVFKPEIEFRREGDAIVVNDGRTENAARIDAATGRLLAVAGAPVRTAPGSVRELQRKLDAEVDLSDTAGSAVAWHEAMSTILELGAGKMVDQEPDSDTSDSFYRGAQLLDLLGSEGVLQPIADFLNVNADGKDEEEDDDEDIFIIPIDQEFLLDGGTMAMLLGFGYLSFTEEFLPDLDWARTFSREMLFIHCGRTRHTREVMQNLLDDPSIGPFGCIICARMLEKADPATARRFLLKARQQESTEAFRNDWLPFLCSRGPIGESFEQSMAALATFGPDKEAEAGALLPQELAGWWHGFLTDLRGQTDGEPLAELISPHMDRLWEDYLGASLQRWLDNRLFPPPDPELVAATIERASVPRFLVRLMRAQNRAALKDLPLPQPDEARPWTLDPALAAAIRTVLVMEHMCRDRGVQVEKTTDGLLKDKFPELAGKEDAEWLEQTGLERRQLGYSGLALLLGEHWLRETAANVEDPPDEVLRDHYDKHTGVFRGKFSTDLVFIKPANRSPHELTRCHRLANAIAGLSGQGLPLGALNSLTEEDAEREWSIHSQTDVEAGSFLLPVLRTLDGLAPGEFSESMELGRGIAVVGLRASKQDPAVGFDHVRELVLSHWKAEQAETAARRWFQQREEGAVIDVLEHPDGPQGEAQEQSAFELLLIEHPGSLIGLLGDFWNKAGDSDQAAGEAALQRLLDARWKDPSKLAMLVPQLIRIKRKDLAMRCLQSATDTNPKGTKRYLSQLMDHHASHDGGKGCNIFRGLRELYNRVYGHDDALRQLGQLESKLARRVVPSSVVTGRYVKLVSEQAEGTNHACIAELNFMNSEGVLIPQDELSIHDCSSFQPAAPEAPYPVETPRRPGNTLDGDPSTFWHSRWFPEPAEPFPHWIIIDLGKSRKLSGFLLRNRYEKRHVDTLKWRISISDDTEDWAEVAAGGFEKTADWQGHVFGQRSMVPSPVQQDSIIVQDAFDDGLSLDWKVINPDPSHVDLTTRKGMLTITSQEGDLSGSKNGMRNIHLVDNPAPDRSEISVIACIDSFRPSADWNQAGVVFFIDEDNYIKFVDEMTTSKQRSRRRLTLFAEINQRVTKVAYQDFEPTSNKIWLCLTKAGDRYFASVSPDGVSFTEVLNSPWLDTPTAKIGILASNGAPSEAPEIDASFDSFKIAAPEVQNE